MIYWDIGRFSYFLFAERILNEGVGCLPDELLNDFINWFKAENSSPIESREELQSLLKANLHIISDFYKCFVQAIRQMMTNKSEWNLISIMGP